MNNAIEWAKGNWSSLLIMVTIALVVLTEVNKASDHWSSIKGPWYKRLISTSIFFVTEILSIAVSKNSPGKWKLPFTSVPPKKG